MLSVLLAVPLSFFLLLCLLGLLLTAHGVRGLWLHRRPRRPRRYTPALGVPIVAAPPAPPAPPARPLLVIQPTPRRLFTPRAEPAVLDPDGVPEPIAERGYAGRYAAELALSALVPLDQAGDDRTARDTAMGERFVLPAAPPRYVCLNCNNDLTGPEDRPECPGSPFPWDCPCEPVLESERETLIEARTDARIAEYDAIVSAPVAPVAVLPLAVLLLCLLGGAAGASPRDLGEDLPPVPALREIPESCPGAVSRTCAVLFLRRSCALLARDADRGGDCERENMRTACRQMARVEAMADEEWLTAPAGPPLRRCPLSMEPAPSRPRFNHADVEAGARALAGERPQPSPEPEKKTGAAGPPRLDPADPYLICSFDSRPRLCRFLLSPARWGGAALLLLCVLGLAGVLAWVLRSRASVPPYLPHMTEGGRRDLLSDLRADRLRRALPILLVLLVLGLIAGLLCWPAPALGAPVHPVPTPPPTAHKHEWSTRYFSLSCGGGKSKLCQQDECPGGHVRGYKCGACQ